MNIGQYKPRPTDDGSYTFFSEEFQETFHSSFGAKQEAEVRYIEPCLIRQLASQRSQISLLDVCYGLGYNSAAALEAIWSVNPQCKVELMALEIAGDVPLQAIEHGLLQQWQFSIPELLTELSNKSVVHRDLFSAKLMLGDARETIQSLSSSRWKADAVFLDPFSPPKCPQLWTVEFLEQVTQCIAKEARLATYSSSAAIRTALSKAGLHIGSVTGLGRKSPGTIASFEYKKLPRLSTKELEHLQTRASIPYRDQTLHDLPAKIVLNRRKEQQRSTLESTSQWRKRWRWSNF